MIEEDAYELLHDYMQRLEKSLSNQKGSKDIIEDIELRIAELCQQALSDKKQVIEIEDIKQIIATLGQPEDFIEDAEEDENFSRANSSQNHTDRKQLYRDSENAKIAGICAGLSNYFNIDVIIIRIVFLILLFTGGFGVPLYIILWIVIPKANSTIDRLRMHGRAITVDSVKDEIENAASRLSNSSKSFANKMRDESVIVKRLNSIGKIIRNILGFGLIAFGVFILIIFLVLFFGGLRFIPIEVQNGFISFSQLGEVLLSDSNDIIFAWLGIFLVFVSVVLFFISNGAYLLARVKSKWTKISTITLISFGVIGIAISFYVGSKTGREFVSFAEIEKKIGQVDTTVLEIEAVTVNYANLKGFAIHKGDGFDSFVPLKIQGDKIISSGVKILYKTSKDSSFHIYQCLSANGFSYDNALVKCQNIKNAVSIESSVLKINPRFSFLKKDKIRNQGVKIIIEIPKNKSVKIGDKIISQNQQEEEGFEMNGYLNHKGEFEEWGYYPN